MPTPLNPGWFRLRAARKTAELLLYQEIGGAGQSSKALFERLEALGPLETITVRINSPGGDVFEALAIHNALSRHPARVVAYVDALCASAATLVALAADEIRMADNALWMIHDPWTVATGTSADLLKQSDLLDTVAGQITAIYTRRTGMTPEAIRGWMIAETWFTAPEALAAGFIDAIDEPLRIAALVRHPLARFQHPPEEVPMTDDPNTAIPPTEPAPVGAVRHPAAPVGAVREPPLPDPDPIPDPIPDPTPAEPTAEAPLAPLALLHLCQQEHGMEVFETLLTAPHTLAQARARLAQADAVRHVCALAKTPDLASGFIKAGLSPEAAALAALNALADRQDRTPIDSAPPADAPKTLTRAQFAQLSPVAQRDAALRGLRITD